VTNAAQRIQRTYLTLTLLSTLAASFIWGINTLFLLDAGLTNTQAFAANAFYTAGQVIFEVPTGVVADMWGRRTSYLLGTATLFSSTLLYLFMWQIEGPFWGWALSSVLIGLGFTFFSGAVEAWLVDALDASGYEGRLEPVFGKGQTTAGVAMLVGSTAGGVVAQLTNLGVPFVLRAAMLVLTFGVAWFLMRDIGFSPHRDVAATDEMKRLLRESIDAGWRNPPMRWIMLASPFSMGVGVFAFYAMQPYLLELYGDQEAFAVAGIAAAIVAGAQIVGGLLVTRISRLFARRTSALLAAVFASTGALVLIGFTSSFWIAIALLVVWALTFSASAPLRQAYVNGIVSSEQRATVLSFDALIASTGGVVAQPLLGRVADVWSFSASYLVAGSIQLLAAPFVILSRRQQAPADLPEAAAA
jgi:MFS family permease